MSGILRCCSVQGQRVAVQRLERCRGMGGQDLRRRAIAQAGMWAFGIVVDTPESDLLAGRSSFFMSSVTTQHILQPILTDRVDDVRSHLAMFG